MKTTVPFLVSCVHKLESLDCNETQAAAAKLVAENKDDLDKISDVECVQFAAFFIHFLEGEDDMIGREHFLYKVLMDKKVAD